MMTTEAERTEEDFEAELCLAIQAGRDAQLELRGKVTKAQRVRLDRVVVDGERAGEQLFLRYESRLRDLVIRSLKKNGRGHLPSEVDEYFADAVAAFVKQTLTFDPGRGSSFFGWMYSTTFRRMNETLEAEQQQGGRSEAEAKVVGTTHGAVRYLEVILQRTPTIDEVVAETRARTESYHAQRVSEKLLAKFDGDLDAATAARMVKEGASKALASAADIAVEVLNQTDKAMSLDGPAGDDQTLADTLDDDMVLGQRSVADRMWALLTPEEVRVVERHAGLDGSDAGDRGVRKLGRELGMEWVEVRDMRERALARLKAPHAQFVALCPIDVSVEAAEMSPSQMWQQLHSRTA